jgi:hypothetical protein
LYQSTKVLVYWYKIKVQILTEYPIVLEPLSAAPPVFEELKKLALVEALRETNVTKRGDKLLALVEALQASAN